MVLSFLSKQAGQTELELITLNMLSANVMIANADREIVYLNEALKQFLKAEEDNIQKDLPHFKVDELIGKNIDIFHKNPAHQQRMLEAMTAEHTATITVGGVLFDLAAKPVFNSAGKRLGTFVEWRDASMRLAIRDYKAQIEAVGRSQAVIDYDVDGNILKVNENYCAIMSVQAEAQKGRAHQSFVTDETKTLPAYGTLWSKLRDGQSEQMEYSLAKPSGEIVWFRSSFNPLVDDNGKVFKIVEFAINITDEVEARTRRENVMREISDDLNNIMQAVSTTSHQANTASDSSESASNNVQSIAAGVEQLVASVNEINQQVSTASSISRDATQEAEKTSEIVSSLSQSASQIENVVQLISDIAEQTNLLALNATIEAARAGEAGKGFAVVAAEVKELASQTGKATEEISQRIGSVQSSTSQAVEAIGSISGIIEKINEITTVISAAVEEQSATTHEMSSNMQIAAEGVGTINDGVREIAQATQLIDESVQKVQTASASLV